MIKKLNIMIGYDKREISAYHTLCQSILENSSIPVSFTPINLTNLRKFYKRKKGPKDSTDFSISRFLVPYLSNFEGISLYLDCDFIIKGDVNELIKMANKNKKYSVWCVKHKHNPSETKKFLKEKQLRYQKKNWSSFMLFNNKKCKILSAKKVEKSNGLYLHQFKWTKDNLIGSLDPKWNILIGYNKFVKKYKGIHFTEGGPYIKEYKKSKHSNEWFKVYNKIKI